MFCKGRHTTTHRQLVLLPTGGMIIDTPGMREMQLWEGNEGLHETFEDIENIAQNCQFKNCQHGSEPGCAIISALADGSLSIDRMESYKKLQKEIRHFETKQNQLEMIEKKKMRKKNKINGILLGKKREYQEIIRNYRSYKRY